MLQKPILNLSSNFKNIQTMRILMTVYLGKNETILLKDILPDERYEHTLHSLKRNFDGRDSIELEILCTGDQNSAKNLNEDLLKISTLPPFRLTYFSQKFEDKNKGTGYLEVQLLRKFFQDKNLDDLYIKISGKYIIENLDDVISFLQKKSHPFGWKVKRTKMIESRCVYLNGRIVFNDAFTNVDDASGYFFEHAVFDALGPHQKGLTIARPIVSGLSGTDGRIVRTPIIKRVIINLVTKALNNISYYAKRIWN